MQVTKISNQNNPISFGAIALHKCAQKNIQKGVNSALQSLSLPQKPIKNILNGPYGHPYTGRSIINNGPIEEGGIFGKIKKLKKIIFDGDDKLSDTLKYAGENIIKVAKEAIDVIL